MALATLKITRPTNAYVGREFEVSGSVSVDQLEPPQRVVIDKVEVQFGENTPKIQAETTNKWKTWKRLGSPPNGTRDGQPIKLTAFLSGRVVPNGGPFTIPPVSVVVKLDTTKPKLTVDDYDGDVTPPTLPHEVTLSGTAQDLGSGVSNVLYQLGDAPPTAADNPIGNWALWKKTFYLPADDHLIKFQAFDGLGHASDVIEVNISVRTSFEPANAETAFAPTTYLQELAVGKDAQKSFAERWIKVGNTGAGPTAQNLTGRFFQPFDRLTKWELNEQATRLLHQTRIAVEVLRARLRQINRPVPPAVEQHFRSAAYEALLLQLGSSHEELRTARIADEATRQALAQRLGFGVEATRPDRLDQITLMPDQVSEAQLEELFGFERTTLADPLHPVTVEAEVLNWRLAATRNRWLFEDSQIRDVAKRPLPIIDPDLVSEENLLTTTAGDRVYDLWKARKTLLDQKLETVKNAQQQGYEHVVTTFIGNLDIPSLAAQDADGVDISPMLEPLQLDLAAFRFLAKCLELANAGGLLETEWQDIIAIVVQVQKRREFQRWRTEESGLTLSPQYFRLADEQNRSGVFKPTTSRWRVTWSDYSGWLKTLAVRIRQLQDVKDAYQSAVDGAEVRALPVLRDSLIEFIGKQQTAPEDVSVAAERLSRELLIDFRANPTQKTTRVNQAIETLLGALFSVRAGRLATDPQNPQSEWTIAVESEFDREWQWMATFRTWRAAMRVFAYPENQLYPNQFVYEEPHLKPTEAFKIFIGEVAKTPRMTPPVARAKAQAYLDQVRGEIPTLPAELKAPFVITEELGGPGLVARKQLVGDLFANANPPVTKAHKEPNYLREIFWLVPMALALHLQRAGHYLTALDWYQTVYAFNLPEDNRKIYYGLELEKEIETKYVRIDEWLTEELNPHIFARERRNAYTRFTVMSIVRCSLDYADAEFSQNTTESVARARTLYETAEDLLNDDDVKPETGTEIPFLPNPVWESLRLQARANLAKIHSGLNIAGMPTTTALTSESSTILPSQYRYVVLVDRAKQLVGIAQQVESAFLAAMERRDAEAYSLMQAGHDLRVAGATVSLQDLKISDADLTVQMAELQQDKAQIQLDYYDTQLREGLNSWEHRSLDAMRTAIWLQTAAGGTFLFGGGIDALKSLFTLGVLGDSADKLGQSLSAFANAASLAGGLAQTRASFERREQEWQLQKSVSDKDVQISGQQILLALNQRQMALMERELAGLQLDHATAVVDFLVNKFTSAELYEWMSGVLGRVYGYFLQQATATAQLAQSQLAFERQEPALSVVQSDYWRVITENSAGETNGGAPDRRGLTGSARLLQDIFQLDQYAFETRQRKLQLTQTLSLAQIAPLELQNLRETGRLIFVSPMELFDRDFPGHYLRLIRRVRISVVALVPPTRGLRATLSASGISRVVTGGESFETVQVRRFPETVAFTSPINATGLFELEPEGELLLPFEGMGVDTFWELQLPKAANPFDYRAIADVLLTIEYTALSSPVYYQQVIKQLERNISGDRMFSFREQFADAWYELNNADALEDEERRMVVNFSTRREDFPPHIEDLLIQHITLRVARKDGFAEELDIEELKLTPEGETSSVGGPARTVEGTASSRRPNGAAWLPMQGKPPVGSWELRLPNTEPIKTWFKEGLIEDLAPVVTFSGTTPV